MRWYQQCDALVRETANVARLLVAGRVADAFLRAGRLDDAERSVDMAIEVAATAGAPHYHGVACQVQARVFAAHGRYEEARAALAESVTALSRIGSRLELARSVYHRALLDSAEGDGRGADEDAHHALAEFAAMRAAPDQALAAKLLYELTRRR